MKTLCVTLFLIAQTQISTQTCKRKTSPNIIVIIGDDMGYNDVSFRGSNQIPTPNIDALGYHGIILDKYYVHNSCTPSRAAFLTGNYPIRSGMQGLPIVSGQNRSLPLDMPIIPQYLKKLGYQSHIIGKWHLGSAFRSSTPTRRGFDTHFGYWNGFLGYFDYYTDFNDTQIEGFDLHDGLRPAYEYQNQYATTVFTNKALDIIDNHNTSTPLFLLVNHLAAHAGRDSFELGVPNTTVTNLKYNYVQNTRRRLYTDIVNLLDESIGKIVKRLGDHNMLENSIILFFSDNGAPTAGEYGNSGSNWPLRGIKLTNFEGAIRGTGVIYSPLFKKRGYINKELIHVTDWLPTLYTAAGGNLNDLGSIDGINQWYTLSNNHPSARTEILVEIDELQNITSIITHNGRYKLITGTFQHGKKDGYYGDSGRYPQVPSYNYLGVLESDVNLAITRLRYKPITIQQIDSTRNQTDLSWCRSETYKPKINCTNACLFDLEKDPCETTNIINKNWKLAQKLLDRIQDYYQFLVPQGDQIIDPKANPQFFNNTWCTWLDDSWCSKTGKNQK